MIALTIPDTMDANAACMRISDLVRRRRRSSVPDAVCIRYDSLSPEQYISMAEAVTELWDGEIVLECDDPAIIPKTMLRMLDRRPIVVGAREDNLEQYCMVANLFKCPITIREERIDRLLDLVRKAESLGVTDVLLDPGISDMNQSLEFMTRFDRLKETVPEASRPVFLRTWSGEYALTMATVAILDGVSVIVADDLDDDCCDVLGALIPSVR